MGQGRSCIQGTPDWLGPYQKPLQKSNSEEFYSKVSELIILGTISKDYSALEDFLSNSNTLDCNGTTSSALISKSKKSATLDALPKKTKPVVKLEDIIYKDTQCKSINFSDEQKLEKKATNIKPVISQNQCAVHGEKPGNLHSHPARHQHYPDCPLSRMSRPNQECSSHNRTPESSAQVPCKSASPKHFTVVQEMPQDAKTVTSLPSTKATTETDLFRKRLDAAMPVIEPENNVNATENRDQDFSSLDSLKLFLFPGDQESDLSESIAASAINSAKESIQRLEDRAENVVEVFGVVLKHMEHGDWSTFCVSASRLCDDIRKILRDNNHISADATELEAIKVRNHVTTALNQLTAQIIQSNECTHNEQIDLRPSFRTLGEALHELMEFLISKELKVIIECLEQAKSDNSVKTSLCSLAEMTMSGALMRRLIVQAGAAQPLMRIGECGKNHRLQLLSLRTLKMLSESAETLPYLNMAGVIDTVRTILLSKSDETVRHEAVSVLAELTSHWTADIAAKQRINPHVQTLVKVLIDIMQNTPSSELFISCAMSLSALSPSNSDASKWLKSHESELKLLTPKRKQESYV